MAADKHLSECSPSVDDILKPFMFCTVRCIYFFVCRGKRGSFFIVFLSPGTKLSHPLLHGQCSEGIASWL